MSIVINYELLLASAKASGDFLRSRFSGAEIEAAFDRDVKLAEDRQSEEMVAAALLSDSSWGVMSEEGGWLREPTERDEPYWVIDPLDGSYNFMRGIPLCAVSIALCQNMTPLAGAVYDFLRDELVHTSDAAGLYRNGARIDRPVTGGPTALSTGIPAATRSNADAAAKNAESLNSWGKVRMIGSAALSLSWVAQGRLDGYTETGIRWWDVAGGLALVRAAGGNFTVTNDDIWSPLEVVANGR
jgi:myo-inositol-1(or 4)-monophosphatase